MASLESQWIFETVEEEGNERSEKDLEKNKMKKKSYVQGIGCFRWQNGSPSSDKSERYMSFEMESDCSVESRVPTHLVILVNGIMGSARNWRFATMQFLKKYPQDIIVHCSECNSSMLTFNGVDVMGERLAEEVISVIKHSPEVQKISFVGHSLGGLVARYAIGRLYGRDLRRESSQGNGDFKIDGSGNPCMEEKSKRKIAGLEPMNFITSATPHLGSRGHKQVPMFGGLNIVEKVVSRTSWILGRTGKHLFLTDNDNGKPPLLLQMANDSGDLQFISALQSFRHRVAYANTCFDHLVGWKTSSIRRQNELPKHQHLLNNNKYPHIVNVEAPKTASAQCEVLLEAKVDGHMTNDMEEAMIGGLTKVNWERVDVNFSRSRQRYFAHSTIQVQNYYINSDGADVILHMIDNFLL